MIIKQSTLKLAIVLMGTPLLMNPSYGLANEEVAYNSTLWIGYTLNRSDYFDDRNSEIKPDGLNLGISQLFADQWQIALSYGDFEGDGTWPTDRNGSDVLERAETKSQAVGLSASWLTEDFNLSLSYSEIENNERSLSRGPLVLELVEGKDKVFSFSYDDYFDGELFTFGWSLGIQHSDSLNRTRQTSLNEPVTVASAQFDQTSWSSFVDLDISHWFENDDFSWAPQLTLSWAWEISSSGDPLLVISRGDERRVFTQFNDRLMGTFRTPDSGFWELSFNFDWHNDWSSSLAYGKSISAEEDLESLSIDIGFSF
ncbi:autotransporter outer membrane beta-barrel domain-containing protein [Aliikangiella coralliicola]|uniref:Autotransporter outer membrane beta-barrel domain-containing protein n=1 Tax=Aliikangiella coralliicola TaxID=2592383 RepID=A0A545U620_9GAMM|nr:autotransporter outer membrane beta-barrel domain-containing protein [Aliikangiella coralliicola]TQV84918.1 autotransporter outer membrane beta-barrel domain-containing protein [Aliikangiella coralliicola]